MKKLFFVFLTGISLAAFAQQPEAEQPRGNGRVTGIVMDSLENIPVQFATVALNNPATGKPIDGTVADEKGKFVLSKVANGKFDVVITFVGYTTKVFHITLTDKNNDVNLGTIKFSFSAEFLNDVVVEGQRSIIEERVDRTVYNAENDKTTAGGDASDVLRRVPMLSVDLDGNVSMRGNSNVQVLINNKPSTIMASSIADALKQIPADQIKSVEVITSPSAKYDAEGSSGIINIITKKNTLQGLTLNVDAGAGWRGSNLGLNGNYRKGKMGFSLGGFGRAGYNVVGSFDNEQVRVVNDALTSTNIQTANTLRRDLFGRYQFGWDYEINKNNNVTASVRYGTRNGWNYQDDLRTRTFDGTDALIGDVLKQVDTKDLSGTVDVNVDYTRYFSKPQREFSLLTLVSQNNRRNDFTTVTELPTLEGTRNENRSYNREVTLQADYQTPMGTTQMVEFGGKNIMRTVSSDFAYFSLNTGNGRYEPITGNGALSNIFNYDQNVSAGYLSYTYNSKGKYSFKAGGRYEYTTIDANFDDPEGTEDVSAIPSYGVFVPSVNVSRKLNEGRTLKAAYNRRIQRPSIQFLNPNIQAANPLQVTEGNPNLEPEFTDNYELSFNTFIKSSSLSFAGFYRNTTGAIQSIRTAQGDTLYTTFANIGREEAFGLNFFTGINIGKKLSLNGGADTYYAMLNNGKGGEENIQNSGWVVSGRLFGNYNMKNGWGLQLFSMFRGREVNLQGYRGGFRMYSLGLRKEFNNKKGSIGFGLENFVTPKLTVKGQTISRSFDINGNETLLTQNSVNVSQIFSFRVNVSYRIGKMSFDQQPRRRRSVNNDDLKEGGDGGGGGGMDMQSGGGGGQRGGGGGQRPSMASTKPATIVKTDPTAVVVAEGDWEYSVESPQGANGGTLKITRQGDAYAGVIINARFNRETPIKDVKVVGNELSFSYEVSFGGNTSMIGVKGAITGDQFTGNMTMGQFGAFPMTAKRKVQ
jgi:outer membrane receptor protein involved in Fe transport